MNIKLNNERITSNSSPRSIFPTAISKGECTLECVLIARTFSSPRMDICWSERAEAPWTMFHINLTYKGHWGFAEILAVFHPVKENPHSYLSYNYFWKCMDFESRAEGAVLQVCAKCIMAYDCCFYTWGQSRGNNRAQLRRFAARVTLVVRLVSGKKKKEKK